MPDLLLQTRREFCVHACQTVSVLTVGAVATGCGGLTSPSDNDPSLPVVNASVNSGTLIIPVDPTSPLAAVGGMARVSTSAGAFLIARTAEASFMALTAICTHEGCVVDRFSDQAFVCHCHGSHFSTSGGVLRGPAGSPLRQFATQFADNVLTVRLTG